jgi:hypothetical protein
VEGERERENVRKRAAGWVSDKESATITGGKK